MSDTRAGLCSATVNGTNLDVDDVKYDTSDLKYELMFGQSRGPQGAKVTPKTGMISMKVRANATTDTYSYQGMVATVVVVTASGNTASGSNLLQTAENLEVDTKEGTFELKFEGIVQEGSQGVS